jgi:hypothetical protein
LPSIWPLKIKVYFYQRFFAVVCRENNLFSAANNLFLMVGVRQK